MLDEVTSHLDIARERQVSEAVTQLPLTGIIVAHRPEAIATADRVIDLGRTSQAQPVFEHRAAALATASQLAAG